MTTSALGFGDARSLGLANLLRSEWTKLHTVRSTYWTALCAVVAAIGAAVIGAISFVHNFAPGRFEGFDAAMFVLQGLFIAQIALGALGVLTITGEYATGMIRTMLTAVPQRRVMIAAKGAVYTAAVLAIGELTSFAAFGIGQAILHQRHVGVSLGDHNALRVVIGAGLYLATVGLLGFALGVLLRRTAGALATFFGVLFLPSALIDLLPQSWHETAMKFAPANAGTQILSTHTNANMLGPWQGLGVLALYVVVVLVAAFVALGRRDV